MADRAPPERLVVVAPGLIRPLLEPILPPEVEARWFASNEEAIALAPLADAFWVDQFTLNDPPDAAVAATKARWLHTTLAGLSNIPVDLARERGGKILRETSFWAEPFDAAPWRAQWVERAETGDSGSGRTLP